MKFFHNLAVHIEVDAEDHSAARLAVYQAVEQIAARFPNNVTITGKPNHVDKVTGVYRMRGQ